jgi:hypothetical protein
MSATAQGRGQPGWPGARPGPLSAVHLGDALTFANTAMLLLLDSQDRTAGDPAAGPGPGGQPAGLTLHRAEIDQVTGMLTEQPGVGIAGAHIWLRAYAYAHDRRLAALARDIVACRLRLLTDPDPSRDGEA